jgi:hypothetical protein
MSSCTHLIESPLGKARHSLREEETVGSGVTAGWVGAKKAIPDKNMTSDKIGVWKEHVLEEGESLRILDQRRGLFGTPG